MPPSFPQQMIKKHTHVRRFSVRTPSNGISHLHKKSCKPCEGGTTPLTVEESEKLCKSLHSDWKLINGNLLRKSILFPDFATAMSFANSVKDIAETEGHHPNIHLTNFNNLTVEYYTHAIGGLSENDFICAAKIDEFQENTHNGNANTQARNSKNSIQLFSFWRSSCSFRVRMVLEYKGLDYKYIPINIRNGQNKNYPSYGDLNPCLTVPTLVIDDKPIPQSPAIIEFLEEQFPAPSILPQDIFDRAFVRQLAAMILDVQPLQNISVLRRLFTANQVREKEEWAKSVIFDGLKKFEKAIQQKSGKFCLGDNITLADFYLIPQVFNGVDYGIDVQKEFSKIHGIYNNVMSLPFVAKAHPKSQPDCPVLAKEE